MLSVTEAGERILAQIGTLGVERVSLLEARGRVIAEDIRAIRQQPPWDNSAMDGYAVRAADVVSATEAAPAYLDVIEEIQAGALPQREVGPGQAARIFTGAPLPRGADAVVRQEDTVTREGQVGVIVGVPEGKDIRRAGEDQEIGDGLMDRGTLVRPAEIGLLAGNRRTRIAVIRRPRVAILSNGDELCEPDQPGHGGQIINTNTYALAAQVAEAGGVPAIMPIAPDSWEGLKAAFAEALTADVVISSGGVSVGDHDHVKGVLEELGVDMDFWKIRMTPGKPVAFGTYGGKPVFGLPGNPVSSMVTFEAFVRPALLKMMGRADIYRGTHRARLKYDIKKRGLPQFLRVTVEETNDGLVVDTTGPQGSGIMRSMSLAHALAFANTDERTLKAGTEVWVMGIDGRLGTSISRPF